MKLFLASFRHPRARLFRRNIINTPVQDLHSGQVWHAKAGLPGQCDIYVYMRGGRGVEVECKSEKGKQSPEQKDWMAFCKAWGIPWIQLEAIDGDDAGTLAKWTRELTEFLKGVE